MAFAKAMQRMVVGLTKRDQIGLDVLVFETGVGLVVDLQVVRIAAFEATAAENSKGLLPL